MGCGINTKTEADEYSSVPNMTKSNPHLVKNSNENKKESILPIDVAPGTIVKTLNGTLYDNIPFVDCLITSSHDLELKLRKYIAAQEVKYQSKPGVMAKPKVVYEPNESDEILNNKINIDFNHFDVIAVSGCLISKVSLNKKNVYEVKPSIEKVLDNQYSAIIVRSPSDQKPTKFTLLGCKPQAIIEQRPLNENPFLIN
jgi:hypothetical protein